MRFFFDTEFIDDGKTIELISIAIVPETGPRHLYLGNGECDLKRANPWVHQNVVPLLPARNTCFWQTREQIREAALAFVRELSGQHKPEFWAYFADYDWVVFCQLFGAMVDLPKGFPMFCLDLKQEMERLGLIRDNLPPNLGAHDALEDAKWVRQSWVALKRYEERRALCE